MSIVLRKQQLRERFRRYRQSLTASTYDSLNRAFLHQVAALPILGRVQVIHCYWPLVERREVDIRPLIQQWYAEGRTVVLPVVSGSTLLHVPFEGASSLIKNKWGLYEPVGSQTVPPGDLDVVLVPALGADRSGHRIGYGKGYYDRFLEQTSALTIGLVYAACLLQSVPVEAHDVPLDMIVTEDEVIQLDQSRKK